MNSSIKLKDCRKCNRAAPEGQRRKIIYIRIHHMQLASSLWAVISSSTLCYKARRDCTAFRLLQRQRPLSTPAKNDASFWNADGLLITLLCQRNELPMFLIFRYQLFLFVVFCSCEFLYTLLLLSCKAEKSRLVRVLSQAMRQYTSTDPWSTGDNGLILNERRLVELQRRWASKRYKARWVLLAQHACREHARTDF